MIVVQRSTLSSPMGELTLYWTDQGLCRLDLPNDERPTETWWKRWFGEVELREAPAPGAWARQLDLYFQGRRSAWSIPLDLRGTAFQLEVWKLLTQIPHGVTISYRELASRSSRPRGFRAVGAANGKNPVPIVVPCHRVVNADGKLGGYSGGLGFKRQLLDLEEGPARP